MKVSNNTISLRIIPIDQYFAYAFLEKFLTTVGSSQCRNSQLARVQRIHDGAMLSPQWIAVSPPQRIRGHFGRMGKRECKSQRVGKQSAERRLLDVGRPFGLWSHGSCSYLERLDLSIFHHRQESISCGLTPPRDRILFFSGVASYYVAFALADNLLFLLRQETNKFNGPHTKISHESIMGAWWKETFQQRGGGGRENGNDG